MRELFEYHDPEADELSAQRLSHFLTLLIFAAIVAYYCIGGPR